MINKFLFLLLVFSLMIIVGCTKDITQSEAENIARQHILAESYSKEPLIINNAFIKNEEWHVQLTVGDDKGTVIINKKGKVQRIYDEWI